MQTTAAGWMMGIGVMAIAWAGLRRLFKSGTGRLDAGAVSQGWVTAHRADPEP